MATIRILVGIVCCALVGSSRLPERNLLKDAFEVENRKRLIAIATQELGVREQSGNNDGPRVEEYLKYIGLGKGHAWCAGYVSWVYGKAGFPRPRTGWSPALFPVNRQVKVPLAGDVFGIYFPALRRIAHAGLVTGKKGDWILSLEGNTNFRGGREGDGVYAKRRHVRTIARYANWLRKEGER